MRHKGGKAREDRGDINKRVSPPPIRLPTHFYLRAISTAGAGGGEVRVGASGCRSPRDGGGGGRRAGERNRNGRGYTQGMKEAKQGKTEATSTTATVAESRRQMNNPPVVR